MLVESHGLHGGKVAGRINGNTVVADAGRAFHQMNGEIRIVRTGHGKGVDEDLGADLLCQSLPVLLDGAASGRGNAPLQIQVCGVLRGAAKAAPP